MIRALPLAVFILGLLHIGCNGSMRREDYAQWVTDYSNGLRVHKKAGEFEFDVQYQPSDYIQLQRMRTGDALEDGLGSMQYYTLTIGLSDSNADLIDYGTSDMATKQRKLYYFSYRFQEDIMLEEGNDRLPCVLYHFEKPVDLRGSRTFLLGFEQRGSGAEHAKLIIDSDQFGSLPVIIKVSKANIPETTI